MTHMKSPNSQPESDAIESSQVNGRKKEMGKPKRGFRRRDFVGLTGAGIVGGSLSRQLPAAPSYPSRVVTRSQFEADVVVVGGGMAGVLASIASARNGASTVLVQDRSVLGGNASSEVRMHIVGADHHGNRPDEDARETGILEEIRLEDAIRNPQRSASMFDLLLYEKVLLEERITLLLNTHCYGVEMEAGRITQVLASRHSTEHRFRIKGKIFVDCSGDGRLGMEAGAEARVGREARSEYGESQAPEHADKKTLGSSILIMARKHDRPMPFKAPGWIHRFEHPLPFRGIGSYEYGFWWNEWGGELDTIKDNEEIRHELQRTALGIWDLIKNSGHYSDSENWALEWVGPIPGKRESRRFIGEYVLREQDLRNGEIFDDQVAYGGWPIDLHPPAGIHSEEPPFTTEQVPLYNIPFRSLYSRNVPNLLFAGRNISTSHVAFGSTRVMGTCSIMGQAVGTAAAICARSDGTPGELAKGAISELQQTLLKDDAYAINLRNSDPDDHARKASVKASSTKSGLLAPGNVVNGVNRGSEGQPNKWASEPGTSMPQQIELRLPAAERIAEIHLVFDTGLHRQLTLSHSDATNRKQIRAPQPETIRDYTLELLHGDSSMQVMEVKGNYQRKRIHRFDPKTADGIRLRILATNGSPEASVFEIRAYS